MRITSNGRIILGNGANATEDDPTLLVGKTSSTDHENYRLGFYTDDETGYFSNKNGNDGFKFRHREAEVLQVGSDADPLAVIAKGHE